jgi:hypothetical protein
MKKRVARKYDIAVLLGFLLLFCCGVSYLCALTNKTDVIIDQINPLIISHDIKKLAREINPLFKDTQKKVLDYVLNNTKNPLTSLERIELVLNLLLENPDQSYQGILLSLLPQELISKKPVIYVAAKTNVPQSIPVVLQWLKQPQKQQEWTDAAIQFAIEQRDSDSLLKIVQHTPLSKPTDVLWHAVEQGLSPELVQPLVKIGARINEVRVGKTLLITAVHNNQIEMVKALLDNKASPNAFGHPANLTPLQIAVNKDYLDIEDLLRKRGARE